MKRNHSALNRIRGELKLLRIAQNEKENFIIEKHLKRKKKYYSPFNEDIQMKNMNNSFEFKKYVFNEFGDINLTLNDLTVSMTSVKNDIKQVKNDINQVKNDINQVKNDISQIKNGINKLSSDNEYSLIITGLNKGIFKYDYKTKKAISDYMNKIVDKLNKNNNNSREQNISNAYKDKGRKNNEKNKNNSFVQRKFDDIQHKKKNDFNSKINLKKKINSNCIILKNIGKKDNPSKNTAKSSFDILDSNSQSQSQSIRSRHSTNTEKIIHRNYDKAKIIGIRTKFTMNLGKKDDINLGGKGINEKQKTYRRKNILAPKISNKKSNPDSFYFNYIQQQKNNSNNSNNNHFKITYSKDSSSSKRNGKK